MFLSHQYNLKMLGNTFPFGDLLRSVRPFIRNFPNDSQMRLRNFRCFKFLSIDSVLTYSKYGTNLPFHLAYKTSRVHRVNIYLELKYPFITRSTVCFTSKII